MAPHGFLAIAPGRISQTPGGLFKISTDPMDPLHVLERRRLQYFLAALVEQTEIPRRKFCHVMDAGSDAGGGGKGAETVLLDRLPLTFGRADIIALRKAVADPVKRHVGDRSGHPERREDRLIDIVAPAFAADPADDITEHRHTEIGILPMVIGLVELLL